MDEILVTVICATYNQEKYIEDAIKGMVNQKTDFKYEIIIHDDASNDHTADIIKKYHEIYPDMIVPIIQKENQYSQGIRIRDIIIPMVKGKYVAFCEGDDYWCDENKLSLQIDFLEKNPEYSACVHNTYKVNCFKKHKKTIMYEHSGDKDYRFEDIVMDMRWHTSSIVSRIEYYKITPDFMKLKKSITGGDYVTNLHLALNGKVHYIDRLMSVYRFGATNSWTVENYKNSERMKLIFGNQNEILDNVNKLTQNKYNDVIEKRKLYNKFQIAIFSRDFNQIKQEPLRTYYKKLSIKEKVKFNIKHKVGFFYDFYRKKRASSKG